MAGMPYRVGVSAINSAGVGDLREQIYFTRELGMYVCGWVDIECVC